MGGCRCTYRTCTIKSDKKTHMFHYPVFEKARCYRWIVNAQRFDFFNLTVSQVRNRVICQHHFEDECFMNYKKEKLTFNAVPTIDGPFCDSSNEDETKLQAAAEKYSFIDVENQYSYSDKKAYYSLKYVDFLSNIQDSLFPSKHETWQQDSFITSASENDKWQHHDFMILPPAVNRLQDKNNGSLLPSKKKKSRKPIGKTKEIPKQSQINNYTQPCLDNISSVQVPNTGPDIHNVSSGNVLNNISEGLDNNYNIQLNSNILPIQSAENTNYNSIAQPLIIVPPYSDTFTNLNEQNNMITSQNIEHSKYYFHFDQAQNKPESQNQAKKQKIKILSEKKISDPVPFVGKLEPVQPSFVLNVPDRFNKEHIDQTKNMLKDQDQNINSDGIINVTHNIPNLLVEELIKEEIQSNQDNNKYQPKIEVEIEQTPETRTLEEQESQAKRKIQIDTCSLLKRNLPPERIAAIEQKRNFNKKLRDIYVACLENSDKSNKSIMPNVEKVKESVASPKGDALRNILGFNAIEYLETRMTRMENILAKKIEQNSKRILDLKNCVASVKTVSKPTQTIVSEESNKKQLYQDLSKFLSPSTNNLVYEELFINKYAQKAVNSDKLVTQKRKRR